MKYISLYIDMKSIIYTKMLKVIIIVAKARDTVQKIMHLPCVLPLPRNLVQYLTPRVVPKPPLEFSSEHCQVPPSAP